MLLAGRNKERKLANSDGGCLPERFARGVVTKKHFYERSGSKNCQVQGEKNDRNYSIGNRCEIESADKSSTIVPATSICHREQSTSARDSGTRSTLINSSAFNLIPQRSTQRYDKGE